MSRDLRFLILADGLFGPETSKTANACIRYTPERVVGIIDATRAGRRAQDVIGFGGDIPVVATLDEGLSLRPNALLVGIAPAGGKLPAEWILLLARAIEHGLEIWSGLHTFVGDVPELAALAAKHRVGIHDLRRPPTRLDVARGRVRNIDATVVLTVGTDCNIGKMTTQLQILDALRAKGIRTSFAATGQTGILIEGRGIAVDAVVADFIAGAAEKMVCEAAEHADWVIVEGQGSLTHPGFSGVTLGLLHGAGPDLMVLCHNAMRETMKGYEDTGLPLRSLRELVKIYEDAAAWRRPPGYPPARVVAVALNTGDLMSSDPPNLPLTWIKDASVATKLPAADPIREGAAGGDRLARALIDARGRSALTSTS